MLWFCEAGGQLSAFGRAGASFCQQGGCGHGLTSEGMGFQVPGWGQYLWAPSSLQEPALADHHAGKAGGSPASAHLGWRWLWTGDYCLSPIFRMQLEKWIDKHSFGFDLRYEYLQELPCHYMEYVIPIMYIFNNHLALVEWLDLPGFQGHWGVSLWVTNWSCRCQCTQNDGICI